MYHAAPTNTYTPPSLRHYRAQMKILSLGTEGTRDHHVMNLSSQIKDKQGSCCTQSLPSLLHTSPKTLAGNGSSREALCPIVVRTTAGSLGQHWLPVQTSSHVCLETETCQSVMAMPPSKLKQTALTCLPACINNNTQAARTCLIPCQ